VTWTANVKEERIRFPAVHYHVTSSDKFEFYSAIWGINCTLLSCTCQCPCSLRLTKSAVKSCTSRFGQEAKTILEAKDHVPNINGTQAAERAKNAVFLSLVTLIDLWPWSSNSSDRWTKHVFRPFSNSRDISYTKQSQTAPKTELYAVHCVR